MANTNNVRSKDIKTVLVPLSAINYLSSALLKFHTTCLADFRKVNTLLTDIETISTKQARGKILDFYKKHNLPETEQIGLTHPLFNEFVKLQNSISLEISKVELQVFSETELDNFIRGKEYSFLEMRALDEFLVKK